MQDELGIAWAEGKKLWKLEIRRNFTAYRNLFREMQQSLVMQPYPDIVNTIICFFLWAHASNHLIFACMWVCVRERETGRERERGRRCPVPPLLSAGTFGGTQICDFILAQFWTNICACSQKQFQIYFYIFFTFFKVLFSWLPGISMTFHWFAIKRVQTRYPDSMKSPDNPEITRILASYHGWRSCVCIGVHALRTHA